MADSISAPGNPSLIVIGNAGAGRPDLGGGRWAVHDGAYNLLATNTTEKAALLAVLNTLPTSAVYTIAGGSVGGTKTVSAHLTAVNALP
ncbi:MAG: hypothetical protein J2P50_15455 [Hyphomicrobiaceae bacterium]|nr:hypothetical protein [Hyphomicrobiaceae bacterium]